MRILFDHGTPAPLIRFLAKRRVAKARDAGWELSAAEAAGFDPLLTTEKNMRYQQKLSGRVVSIVVLGNSQWRIVEGYVEPIAAAVDEAAPGSYAEMDIPLPPKKPFTCS